jgi:hypothetical protein
MSLWTKIRDTVSAPLTVPAQFVAKEVFLGIRKVSGSEKFASSIVSGGDPFTLFGGFDPKYFKAENPTTFRSGVQAGRLTSVSVAAIYAGGAAAAGTLVPSETGAGIVAVEAPAAFTLSSTTPFEAEGAASLAGSIDFPFGAEYAGAELSQTAIATGAGTTPSWYSSLIPSGNTLFGAGGLFATLLKPVAAAVGGKAGGYINEVFGGSSSSPGVPGSGSSTGSDGGTSPGSSWFSLPVIIIGALLLFLLIKKGRK